MDAIAGVKAVLKVGNAAGKQYRDAIAESVGIVYLGRFAIRYPLAILTPISGCPGR
jgi:hypothetical protein